jgi:hypothetical protein
MVKQNMKTNKQKTVVEKNMSETDIKGKIERLISKIRDTLVTDDVYVTSIEKVEDYDAWFFSLHIEKEKFSIEEIEEIRRIIAQMNFVERDVSISVKDGKVKVFFDLRW